MSHECIGCGGQFLGLVEGRCHSCGSEHRKLSQLTTLRADNERLMARLRVANELLTSIEFGGPYKEGCNFCGATEAPHATNCALDYYDHIDDGEDARAALKGEER